jgi:hypothetical protein
MNFKMAGLTGLEPATSCVTGRRSNQTELQPLAEGWKSRKECPSLCHAARRPSPLREAKRGHMVAAGGGVRQPFDLASHLSRSGPYHQKIKGTALKTTGLPNPKQGPAPRMDGFQPGWAASSWAGLRSLNFFTAKRDIAFLVRLLAESLKRYSPSDFPAASQRVTL